MTDLSQMFGLPEALERQQARKAVMRQLLDELALDIDAALPDATSKERLVFANTLAVNLAGLFLDRESEALAKTGTIPLPETMIYVAVSEQLVESFRDGLMYRVTGS